MPLPDVWTVRLPRFSQLTWRAKLAIEADCDLAPLRRARDSWKRKLQRSLEGNLMGESGAEAPSAAMLSVGQAFRKKQIRLYLLFPSPRKWCSRESRSPSQPDDG